ncbi:hypothetical protein AB833_05200 [Chromatiales bacterium (ex Bugula neritina AB1)]|nr:hypothetical protein AB833_05200 [Chromatiales bacterium (ex Bugula neritina AB1)]
MAICVEHTWIPMNDGARLGARIWLPENIGVTEEHITGTASSDTTTTKPVPAILEYIPYRKDDYSAIRDATTIAWFAEQGYVCLRVDMRGSGSSDGILDDEYSNQEIDDGVDVINWIAAQPWCDGNVGTIGISWGGITGLQLAQRQPDALKTVIALGATEFRYYDDGSYYMGCLTGQTIGWAAIMFGYNTRPPDPALIGDDWRALWMDRLQNTPHYLDHFLSHQREDDYWLRGTVGTDYDAIKIPIYAVSGHADCWPNTVPRLLEMLNVPKRGLQGAWCHRYPHLGIPGPTVAFLPDALRWFDQWLKGRDTGIMDEATYQVYLQDSIEPKPYYDHRPGKWIGESGWPSKQIHPKQFYPGESGLSGSPQPTAVLNCSSPQTVGMASGEYMPWFAFGPADELPDDQQIEDAESLVFDTTRLEKPLEIVGNTVLTINVKSDQPEALLAARLCDIRPDGRSTLITRGIMNLCQRNGKNNPQRLEPDKWYTVSVTLNNTAYKIKKGHRLRLACSNTYWPIAWPTPGNGSLQIRTSDSVLSIPCRDETATNGTLTKFEATTTPRPLAHTKLTDFKQRREVITDPKTGAKSLEIYSDNGKVRFEASQLVMASTNLQRYTIQPDDPLSAKAEYEWEWEYSRGDDWKTRTFTRTIMTCDTDNFHVHTESIAWEGDQEVFNETTDKSYKRDCF